MSARHDALFEAVDATWPAARYLRSEPWMLRAGQGGGKRVSAATALQPVTEADITEAEQEMAALGQAPLFMIRNGDAALDALLAARGYQIVDPVSVMVSPVNKLTDTAIPPLTTYLIWEPLAVMIEIWAQGGIGPARIDVMHRAATKTGIFARHGQSPAGTAFAARHGRYVMVHAVEVLPGHRRAGIAGWIMRRAALWAQSEGATDIAVLCTNANTAALALYSGLGFETVAQYHYRHRI